VWERVLSYVLLTKPSSHYLSSLQHHVHIRHRRGYDDEQKAVVVMNLHY